MENKFLKNNKYNDKIIMDTTEKELLVTMHRLKNSKLPSKESFETTFGILNEELDRISKLFNDNKKIVPESNSDIRNNLSNYDKFLNDVPDVVLDFTGNFNNKIKVEPLLKINVDGLNKMDSVINDLGKAIEFERRKETIDVKNITALPMDQSNIEFKPKNESLDLKDKIKINDHEPIVFKPNTSIININPINNINPNLDNIKFEKRNDKIKLDSIEKIDMPTIQVNKKDIDDKMAINKNFFDNNKKTIEDRIDSVNKEMAFIEDFTKGLKIKLEKFRLEFNNIKIKESLTELKFINKDIFLETIEIDGLDENLEGFIPRIYEKDSVLVLNDKNYYLESIDFNEDKFITNLVSQDQELPIQLVGGSLKDFIILSKKYELIIIKRKIIIDDFIETINEYNVLFIQYFNYKFFLMKNMQKFYNNKRTIYQYLSYTSFKKYLKIITHLNKIISNPKKIFQTKIPIIVNNVHTLMYFKHFLIIKILFNLFNEIDEKFIDKSSIIDIFASSNIYFLIFNLYFKILDNYNETFKF